MDLQLENLEVIEAPDLASNAQWGLLGAAAACLAGAAVLAILT